MTDLPQQRPDRLRDSVARTLRAGTAQVTLTTRTDPETAGDLMPERQDVSGVVDFDAGTCSLGKPFDVVLDHTTTYARDHDGRWTRRTASEGEWVLFHPMWALEVVRSCVTEARPPRAAFAAYALAFDRRCASELSDVGLSPAWSEMSGTLELDDEQRVRVVSVRLSTADGSSWQEMIFSFVDYGCAITVELPPTRATPRRSAGRGQAAPTGREPDTA